MPTDAIGASAKCNGVSQIHLKEYVVNRMTMGAIGASGNFNDVKKFYLLVEKVTS